MRRRVRRDDTADDGFTLTELLVSIGIFGVVSALVTTASVTGLHKQTETANRDDALAQMRAVLQRIDRDIRATSPLLSVSATRLVVRELEPTVTRVVTYEVTGTNLTVSETDTTSGGTTTTVATKTLLPHLTTSSVFTVAPIIGYVAPSGSGVNPTTCVMGGTTIDAGCVGTITVRLAARPEYVNQPLTMTDNGVQLRNAA